MNERGKLRFLWIDRRSDATRVDESRPQSDPETCRSRLTMPWISCSVHLSRQAMVVPLLCSVEGGDTD